MPEVWTRIRGGEVAQVLKLIRIWSGRLLAWVFGALVIGEISLNIPWQITPEFCSGNWQCPLANRANPSRKLRIFVEYEFSCDGAHADSLPQTGPNCYLC